MTDFNHAEYLHQEVPGVEVPDHLLLRMRAAGAEGPKVGQEIARELIAEARGASLVHGVLLTSAGGQAQELADLVRSLTAVGVGQ